MDGQLKNRQPYRLGLDIGTNSIGGWLLALDGDGKPRGSLGGFVRVFSDGRDPKTGASLAEDRRIARAMRRRRDRYLRRRAVLLEEMIAAGLLPAEESARKALERLDCQTALKRDPLSASKKDPPSERVCAQP